MGDGKSQSGQVEVETAIVLPMVVFLILGLLQLGLLNQAWIVTKYAAYRAVRTGALRNMDVETMEAAAVAAALPVLSYPKNGRSVLSRSDDGASWVIKYSHPGFRFNRMTDCGLKYATVDILRPNGCDLAQLEGSVYQAKGKRYIPFDFVETSGRDVLTKLRIELTINYRMIIPFADWVIYKMWRGARVARVLRVGRGSLLPAAPVGTDVAAAMGVYIVPIRAQYGMKLQSDVPLDALPPAQNCDEGKPSNP